VNYSAIKAEAEKGRWWRMAQYRVIGRVRLHGWGFPHLATTIAISVRYYSTDIVTFYPTGHIVLKRDGWGSGFTTIQMCRWSPFWTGVRRRKQWVGLFDDDCRWRFREGARLWYPPQDLSDLTWRGDWDLKERMSRTFVPGEEGDFQAAMRESPEDDAPALTYADWLQDRGRDEEADRVRLSIRHIRENEVKEEMLV
jgi:uncharacterized protein (TIGR02996 family)